MSPRRRPPQPTEFGRLVRAKRQERGLTQEGLAEAVGRSQEWVGKVELGEIENPRDTSLRRLSAALDIPLPDIYIALNRAKTRSDAERIAQSGQHEKAESAPQSEGEELVGLINSLPPDGRIAVRQAIEILLKLRRADRAVIDRAMVAAERGAGQSGTR